MLVNVVDPVLQTFIFTIILFIVFIITAKRFPESTKILNAHTDEVKGLAILMVIFAHTGYYLASDTRFLFPYSIFAGVGVNLFLFLSGFGLTSSELKEHLNPWQFYRKRFLNLYVPLWIVISILYLMDTFLLGHKFPLVDIVKSYLGLFSIADLYKSLDSPLWYFTFIIFYYLIFPVVFSRKTPIISIVLFTILSLIIVNLALPVSWGVRGFYQTHIFAFPLGMFFALLNAEEYHLKISVYFRYTLIAFFGFIFAYTSINSGVGKGLIIEQMLSLVTMFCLLIVTVLKKVRFTLLSLIGIYSYEIYLIQWPLMYRYDVLYKNFPAWVATLIYLGLLVFLAYLLQNLSKIIKLAISNPLNK